MDWLKQVREQLDEATKAVLSGKLKSDECEDYQARLKLLREVLATHKAYGAYIEDYGVEDETKERRTSDTRWL